MGEIPTETADFTGEDAGDTVPTEKGFDETAADIDPITGRPKVKRSDVERAAAETAGEKVKTVS